MKSGQRFVYGALATGLWVLGRGVVLAGGSGPLSAVEGLGIVWLGVSVLFVVFFWWGRTRARGPLDLGKHGRRLAWFWLVGVGLAVFEAPLCWWLRVEGLGMGDELGVGLAVGDVVLVSLVAVGLRWREPWAGPAATTIKNL